MNSFVSMDRSSEERFLLLIKAEELNHTNPVSRPINELVGGVWLTGFTEKQSHIYQIYKQHWFRRVDLECFGTSPDTFDQLHNSQGGKGGRPLPAGRCCPHAPPPPLCKLIFININMDENP